MAKSKWEEVKDKLILIEGWARDGLTNEQIAQNLGIGETTLYKMMKEHSEVSEALKKGKEVIDYEVENALLKKALGYTKTLKKHKLTKEGNIVEIKEEIHVPADTTAQIYWLNNRKPKQWRNKVELNDEENKKTLEKLDEVLKNIGGVI